MDLKNLERRRTTKEKMIKDGMVDDIDNELEEEEFGGDNLDEDKKKKSVGGYGRRSGGSNSCGACPPSCQAERCGANMSDAKRYHRRHKVCELHSKAAAVMVSGLRQRFCQQCSRFHEITEFDDSKRSCRRRLAGHNERRRKSPAVDATETTVGVQSNEITSSGHAVGQQSKDSHFRQADGRGRIQNSNPGASTYKSFNSHN